jgi:hypothetical protein
MLNRDRILTALSKIDSLNDSNHAYIQLIKNLSLPLNRLEKYANLLKEYLHNLEVNCFLLIMNREIFLLKRNFILIEVMHNEQRSIMLN